MECVQFRKQNKTKSILWQLWTKNLRWHSEIHNCKKLAISLYLLSILSHDIFGLPPAVLRGPIRHGAWDPLLVVMGDHVVGLEVWSMLSNLWATLPVLISIQIFKKTQKLITITSQLFLWWLLLNYYCFSHSKFLFLRIKDWAHTFA